MYILLQKPRLSFDIQEEEKHEKEMEQNADLFSRISAYKQKMQDIEVKQKGNNVKFERNV